MQGLSSWFAEGGTYMLAVAALDGLGVLLLLVAWLMALWARVRGRTGAMVKAVPALVMIGSFAPVVVGGVAYFQGRAMAIAAAGEAAPTMRKAVIEAGLDAALIPLRFGGYSTVLLGSMAVLALMLAPWADRER
jgi:hypothetical protein